MYFVLLTGVIVLLIVSYWIFDRDIMNPSVFLCLFFVGAIIFGLYQYEYWHLYEYSGTTTLLFLTGIVSFLIGTLTAKYNKITYTVNRSIANRGKIINYNVSNKNYIKINDFVYAFVVAFSLIFFCVFLFYYRTRFSGMDLFNAIVSYRTQRGEESLPEYIDLMMKLLSAFSHCFLFIIINNAILKKLKFRLTIPIIIYCIASLMCGLRGNILQLLFAGIMAWYILYHRINGWHYKITSLVLRKGIKIGGLFLILFWAFMIITNNREISDAGDSFMPYICNYYSGAISAFDMYIKQGGKPCQWFGQETFVVLNNNLDLLFETGHSSLRTLEFRSGYGYNVVNIYSSFRRFYHDFGIPGVVILSGIQGYITSRLYYIVKRKQNIKNIDFLMVLYCYYFHTVPYIVIEDFFYTAYVSFSGIIRVVLLYFAYYVTFNSCKYKDL